jgi:hypothetical protein
MGDGIDPAVGHYSSQFSVLSDAVIPLSVNQFGAMLQLLAACGADCKIADYFRETRREPMI